MSDEVLRKRIDELDREFNVPLPPAETHEELIARLEGFEIPQLSEDLIDEVVVPDLEPEIVPEPEPEIPPEPEPEPEPEPTPEPTPEPKTMTLEAVEGTGHLRIAFDSATIVRDEFGRVVSLIGPDFVRTLVRDETGAITGVLQEREQIDLDD
jgi:hypothetical protein